MKAAQIKTATVPKKAAKIYHTTVQSQSTKLYKSKYIKYPQRLPKVVILQFRDHLQRLFKSKIATVLPKTHITSDTTSLGR